jgi:predicted DNA-binding WGR domain protein
MNRKFCLMNESATGPMGRGQNGKKKVYEITVIENVLRCEWGMAEKPNRQSSVRTFRSSQSALSAAYEKMNSKRDRGYELVYSV